MNVNERLFAFIKNSPSMFHAIDTMKKELATHGFILLDETKPWKLEAGKDYMVTRNHSSIIAFRMPQTDDYHYQIVASHSDSPCFLVKPHAELACEGFIKLNVEVYGGTLLSTWFDRPLSLAGRLLVKEDGKIISKYVNVDQDLLIIPNLAIHMNREANQGVRIAAQNDILPLYAMGEHTDLLACVAQAAGVEKDAIVTHELYVYPRAQGTLLGDGGAWIGCPKLDNLQSAFSSLQALLQAHHPDHVSMLCCFDNEEIGSGSRQGADGCFLADVMARIDAAYEKTPAQQAAIRARSFFVSCDNAHAFHPNYPQKADPNHHVYLNKGVVIKHSARKAYTSDAFSAALFRALCEHADVPVQDFVNHNEIIGGGTLGAISSSHVSIPSIDIGLAQLAMHSAYEIGGAKDTAYMIAALSAFFSHDIILSKDGEGAIHPCPNH